MLKQAASIALAALNASAKRDARTISALEVWRDGGVPFLRHRDDRAQVTMLRALLLVARASDRDVTIFVSDVHGPSHAMDLVNDVVFQYPGGNVLRYSDRIVVGKVKLCYVFSWECTIDVMFFAGGEPTPSRMKSLARLFSPTVEILRTEYTLPPFPENCNSDDEDDSQRTNS